MRTLHLSLGAGIHLDLETRDPDIDLDAFSDWRVFRDWLMRALPHFVIRSIEVQSVDIVGDEGSRRILFAKVKVDATNLEGRWVPGIIKLRGDVVSAVVEGVMPDGSRVLVKVVQPRLCLPHPAHHEVVAGMLDGGDPVDKIIEEILDETGVTAAREDIIDLTALAYPNSPRGIAGGPGSLDAHSLVYYARVTLDEAALATIEGTHGVAGENEHTRTELVPIDDAWRTMTDTLSLAALFLYEKLRDKLPA